MSIVGVICPLHGYVEGDSCEECKKMKVGESAAIHIFKPMVYEDICDTPILIESKRQLREECKKHGVIAARLL
jgi:hypothetical protein